MNERNPAPAPEIDDLPYATTPAQRQRLDLIHHLLEFGHQILIVQGEPGAGKTRMLDIIMDEAGPNWLVSSYRSGELRSPELLLAALSASLGLIGGDSAPALALTRIRRELVARHAEGQVVILAIDDADELDSGSCALLYELTRNEAGNSALRVLLTGINDGQLALRFEELSPERVLLHVVDVAPLSAAAAAELFEHIAESMASEVRIADDEIDALVDACEGNPARLIRALYALVEVESVSPEGSTPGVPVRPFGRARTVMVLCLLGAVVGVIVQQIGIRRTPEPAIIEMRLPLGGAPGSASSVVMPLVKNEAVPLAQTADARIPEQVLSPELDTDEGVPDDAEPSAYAVVAADTGNEAVLPAPERSPAVAPVANPIALEGAASVGTSPVVEINATPTLPPVGRNIDRTVAVPAQAAASAAPRERSQARPSPAPATPAVPKDASPSALNPSDSVLAQAGQRYVIQLFGSRDEAAARRMISERGLAGRATVLTTQHAGARWYVVVYGSYPNRELANQAIAKLPAALVAAKPWARSIASLKP